MSKFRRKLTRKGSKRLFTTTAVKIHKANLTTTAMRGGERL